MMYDHEVEGKKISCKCREMRYQKSFRIEGGGSRRVCVSYLGIVKEGRKRWWFGTREGQKNLHACKKKKNKLVICMKSVLARRRLCIRVEKKETQLPQIDSQEARLSSKAPCKKIACIIYELMQPRPHRLFHT